jgi:hypothetical protein
MSARFCDELSVWDAWEGWASLSTVWTHLSLIVWYADSDKGNNWSRWNN